ncbi:BamA/TamA family outer membrane protein [Flavobacterium sp.]|uniref:BamA/TamA family outer membrane protein n=1 Tax=Flavobacterium sp. TaxID=239 RepID=UPI003C6800B7
MKIAFFFVLFATQIAFSQEDNKETTYPMRTFYDLFKKEDSIKAEKPDKKTSLIILPTLGYQPANGFTLGFISQYSFKKNPENKISLISGGASYSTKKQILTYLKNNMYLKDDTFFLSGDCRYYVFSQSNFGLGSAIIPYGEAYDNFDLLAIEQPMKYNYFKFHETVSYNLLPNFFAGAGIHIDAYSKINDELLDVSNDKHTYHYDYSQKYGFNPEQYGVKGMSLNFIFDTRDNLINTNNGLFFNLNYRFNPKINTTQQQSTTLLLESRYFIPLSKTNKQHVLGFWSYGQFVTSGHLPYLNLPAIGWDQNSRSGKGYIQGLIRGANLVYFETEYRFPITRNQLISGTVFANATTASDVAGSVKLFQSIQPAAGIGLRILLDKKTLTNFVVNAGLGRGSQTFYFNDGEGF